MTWIGAGIGKNQSGNVLTPLPLSKHGQEQAQLAIPG